MMERKKINWLLILQGWAMLWVIIGHSYLGIVNVGPTWENLLVKIAYSFHMPLFMLVSGWLFFLTRLSTINPSWGGQKWTYGRIIIDKSLRLLLPGFVFSLLALVLKLAFPGEMSRQVGLSLRDIAHQYLYPNDNPMRELWFIATLFWFFLLTPFWNVVLKKNWVMWVTIIVLTVLHFWHPNIQFLCIDRAFEYAIWFFLGLFVFKMNFIENVLVKRVYLVLIVGVMIYIMGLYSLKFITTMGGIVFSFAFAIIADKYIPKLFIGFRNYTYQIFLMGIFAQIAVKIIYRHVNMPYILVFLLCVVAGIYVPVIVSKILQKINCRFLLLCAGLNKKKK